MKQSDRAAEFEELLVTQGHVTQSLQFSDWKPTDEEQAKINRRGARLVELAELLGYPEPERAVNDAIAKWVSTHPLALNKRRVKKLIDESPSNIDGQVGIQVGGTTAGYYYQALASDIEMRQGVLVFKVPDAVAEYFRQAGRKALQSELRAALNVPRA